MIHNHPDCVDRAAYHTTERKYHPDSRRLFLIIALVGQGIKVRRHCHSEANGNKRQDGHPRQLLLIQEEIDGSDGGREQYAADLVEGDGGVGEGEVLQYHVQTHGGGQWQHFEDLGSFGFEESEDRS